MLFLSNSNIVLFFSLIDYLSKVLRSHTEQACDGSHLNLHCPRDTTLSIQSAFYGRKVPSSLSCPSLNPGNTVEENLNCTAPTTLQVGHEIIRYVLLIL